MLFSDVQSRSKTRSRGTGAYRNRHATTHRARSQIVVNLRECERLRA
jgi:hypothetical protein